MVLDYKRVGEPVEARATGTAEEIAALVVAIQGRQDPKLDEFISRMCEAADHIQ